MVTESVQEARFYRFPIAALHGSLDGVFGRATDFALINCANSEVPKMFNEGQIELIAQEERDKYPAFKGKLSDSVSRILVASRLLGLRLGTLDTGTATRLGVGHSECLKHFGKCFVVFPIDPFWEYEQSQKLREFAILCGVLAGIGNDPFKKLQYERIGAMASGFSTAKEMNTFGNRPPRFTRDQIRWTVDKLETKGWFVRCPANKRHMYYSKKLTLPELQLALAKMVVAKQKKTPPMAKRAAEVTKLLVQLQLADIDPRKVPT